MSVMTDRISEAIVGAVKYHDASSHAVDATGAAADSRGGFSIAISREAGTRGPEVARCVGRLLGWQAYDQELLEIVAQELHVAVNLLYSVDERHITWLQECVEAFAAVPAVRETKYVRRLIETMLTLSTRGRCVIVGRGSPFVLPSAKTLRVRLCAPVADRIAVVSRERNMTWAEAARFVERTDRERAEFIRLHFLHDASDISHYDLVVNTGRFSVDESARLIVDGLEQKMRAALGDDAAASAPQLSRAS
jgi:cytidylate kinase